MRQRRTRTDQAHLNAQDVDGYGSLRSARWRRGAAAAEALLVYPSD